jgi:hypothetical protein
VNEIRLKSIFQLSSHMKSAKFMARGLVTERIFSLIFCRSCDADLDVLLMTVRVM